MVIGWAMDDNYKTLLITSAIKMAARNAELPEGAIFHSDRGSQLHLGGVRRRAEDGRDTAVGRPDRNLL
jgi:transposase InsO family protein